MAMIYSDFEIKRVVLLSCGRMGHSGARRKLGKEVVTFAIIHKTGAEDRDRGDPSNSG